MNLHEMSFEEASAVARRRNENRLAGRPLDYVAPETRTVEQREADEARLEKAIELAGDKQLRALGFEVVKFSHPGKTKQTPGIPDRRYYHRGRRLALWWEAKSPTGRQRPDQRIFQEMCDAVGDPYVLGTDADLFAWLVAQRIAFVAEGGLLVALPYERYTPIAPITAETP